MAVMFSLELVLREAVGPQTHLFFMPYVISNGVAVYFRQQELSNLLHEKKYLKALGIAISLDQPHTVLRVIKGTGIDTLRLNSG